MLHGASLTRTDEISHLLMIIDADADALCVLFDFNYYLRLVYGSRLIRNVGSAWLSRAVRCLFVTRLYGMLPIVTMKNYNYISVSVTFVFIIRQIY